jgi:DNA invertase Pin-like site-specific DNA recombinase
LDSIVAEYLNGGRRELLAEFTEVESGKRNDRPELARALDLCRRQKATLMIAKLDRLARNVAFVANLMESGVEFIAVDFPQANRLTIHILAAVAEHEREMISQRTKAALQARARGKKLGWAIPARLEEQIRATRQGNAGNRAAADKFASNALPVVRDIEAAGIKTLKGIAAVLNARGIRTARGGSWYATTEKPISAADDRELARPLSDDPLAARHRSN